MKLPLIAAADIKESNVVTKFTRKEITFLAKVYILFLNQIMLNLIKRDLNV